MVAGVQTPTRTMLSFIECDVTNIWNWRKKHKDAFENEKVSLTFTPIFMEAVAQALKVPMMNIAVDGDKIIKRKYKPQEWLPHCQTAANLIVPVIKMQTS
jgi:2-oxoglutarate dehydrogenase E2 component (dihydrolipoamide succinyltransferase)